MSTDGRAVLLALVTTGAEVVVFILRGITVEVLTVPGTDRFEFIRTVITGTTVLFGRLVIGTIVVFAFCIGG